MISACDSSAGTSSGEVRRSWVRNRSATVSGSVPGDGVDSAPTRSLGVPSRPRDSTVGSAGDGLVGNSGPDSAAIATLGTDSGIQSDSEAKAQSRDRRMVRMGRSLHAREIGAMWGMITSIFGRRGHKRHSPAHRRRGIFHLRLNRFRRKSLRPIPVAGCGLWSQYRDFRSLSRP